MRSYAIVAAVVFLVSGCGAAGLGTFDSLLSMQPYVVAAEPVEGSTVPADSIVSLEFSRPVDPDSVGASTLALVKDDGAKVEDVVDDLDDGDIAGIDGIYEFAGAGRVAVFRPRGRLEEGADYYIVATTAIFSADGLPLNQRAGASPKPFVSRFRIDGIDGGTGSGSADGDGIEGEAGSPPEEERVRPSHLVINEILYDAVGSDSNGDVFVELYGEAGGDITGYELVFVNGEDGVIKDTVEMPEDAVIGEDGIYLVADAITGSPGVSGVAGADHVVNFDPQNGPDCVQLVDHEGALVDAIGYGDPLVEKGENGLACYEDTPAVDVGSGFSLSRALGADLDVNAVDFIPLETPTPGVI